MKRTAGNPRLSSATLVLVCLSALAAVAVSAQQVPTRRALDSAWPEVVKVDDIEIVHVQKGVYMLVGGGANVTVLHGDEGVVIVDSGAPGQTGRLLAALRRL
ncbi:MAG TPA: hypothetical protein VEY91_06285, partial [Candidatus Limnocylindria bacterium]|nr:hypothetical protein [Candidatus Limnocylindria bacterium]